MLEQRSNELEIMDDLSVSGEVVKQTLRELNTINRTLGGNQISVSAFKKLIKHESSVTLADLGCGGGDMMVEMTRASKKLGVRSKFIGIDANRHIVAYAQKNTQGYKDISYQSINIFSEAFGQQTFDIIHCCLFVHHFTTEELVALFKQFRRQARLGVIINDLHRHPVAYWSISLLTALFSRSGMVKNDAAVSVARGFKKKELEKILGEAGINQYQLNWKWAFRWRLFF